ncbi:uncharacterized protein DS421_5g153710 [Arachis hypogaea]|nr:uncharacterized protein DS421_5g153710 [Arachis hypogaea]
MVYLPLYTGLFCFPSLSKFLNIDLSFRFFAKFSHGLRFGDSNSLLELAWSESTFNGVQLHFLVEVGDPHGHYRETNHVVFKAFILILFDCIQVVRVVQVDS